MLISIIQVILYATFKQPCYLKWHWFVIVKVGWLWSAGLENDCARNVDILPTIVAYGFW